MTVLDVFADAKFRPCKGCAHGASNVPFPGAPSGEHSCCSCSRNPQVARNGPQRAHEAPCRMIPGPHACHCPEKYYKLGGFGDVPKVTDNYITLDQLDHKRELQDAAADFAGEAVLNFAEKLKERFGPRVFDRLIATEAEKRLRGDG